MNIKKSIKREREIIKEINTGNTENLQELLKLSFDFNQYYNINLKRK